MRAFACSLLLWALAAPAAAERPRLAVMDLAATGVTDDAARAVTALLTHHVDQTGLFEVVSRDDVRSMLSHQQDKRLLGGDPDPEALERIGAAVGAAYLVTGSLSQLGDARILNAQLVVVDAARVATRVKRTLPDDAVAADEVLKVAAHALVRPARSDHGGFAVFDVEEPGAAVFVDEKLVGSAPLPRTPLGGGLHAVEVRKDGFEPWAGTLDVPPGRTTALEIRLIPSADFIEDYERRALTTRVLAWSSLGLAAASAGLSAFFYAQARDDADASAEARRQLELNPFDDAARARARSANDEGETHYALYWTFLGAAAAAAGTSAVLFWVGDPPGRYAPFAPGDSAPPPAGGGVAWQGSF